MKNMFYIILFAVSACSQSADLPDTLTEICSPASDAIQYPAPWTKEAEETFVIPDETLRTMSVCGLLETWYTHPQRVLGPWCAVCSSHYVAGVSSFNRMVANDKVVAELFERDDCVPVLFSGYRAIIARKGEKSGNEKCFEMLLASDVCMSALSDDEQIKLAEMALKMFERNGEQVNETRHILVAVMKAFNYAPFIQDAKNYPVSFPDVLDVPRDGFSEWMSGYDICSFDVVEKYAKQFLKEKL
jgi:hypothetical protein